MMYEAIAIETALRQRMPVTDELFDRLYPSTQRYRSDMYWTPIEVAIRVAELLAPSPGKMILDIGSGVGKACLVGALTTPCVWYGAERSPMMVRTAKRISQLLRVDHRTTFINEDVTMLDWSQFGGFYLYNPFAEALFVEKHDPCFRHTSYLKTIARVERKLAMTPVGTHVVTYHGFGGQFPVGFELVQREPVRDDFLCLWIRRSMALE